MVSLLTVGSDFYTNVARVLYINIYLNMSETFITEHLGVGEKHVSVNIQKCGANISNIVQ